jgi:hypothetical protein
MLKRLKNSNLTLFLLPILFSLGLFTLLNLSCQSRSEDVSGSVKLLYTSEVGGKLDPCG